MEKIIKNIIERSKQLNKTIILPESDDERVLKAVELILKKKIANIILIGDESKINLTKMKSPNLKIINPKTSPITKELEEKLYELRKDKGLTEEEATKLIEDKMYFSCMLLKEGYADGIVSGANHTTSETLKPALQIIKTKENTNIVSSFMIMDVNSSKKKGIFVFSDIGLIQKPTSEQLSQIAGETANSVKDILGITPKIAMLSYSTKGSSIHDDVEKVKVATILAKGKYPDLIIDGEIQADAAIDPIVSKRKEKDSILNGEANVLIFPDLNSGNISYKLVQRLSDCSSYGPICQGFNKPVNDLSRGCTTEEIVITVAITSVQSEKHKRTI